VAGGNVADTPEERALALLAEVRAEERRKAAERVRSHARMLYAAAKNEEASRMMQVAAEVEKG
jgi:hypothetical protein